MAVVTRLLFRRERINLESILMVSALNVLRRLELAAVWRAVD